jgi:hypothetical protein
MIAQGEMVMLNKEHEKMEKEWMSFMIHNVISSNCSQVQAPKLILIRLRIDPPWIRSKHSDRDLICLGILCHGPPIQTSVHQTLATCLVRSKTKI